MSEKSYWTTFNESRVGRRRVLQAGAGLGLSASVLALLGCSSGSKSGDSQSKSKDATSLAVKPADTTSKAVKGGTYQASINADPTAFDVISGLRNRRSPTQARVYSRLVKYQAYKYPDAVQPVAAPDAASSWETSPDGLTVTYKIRPGQKFDSRPPTSGRVMNSGDVKYSADRFMKISPQRNVLERRVSRTRRSSAFEAPDANTVAASSSPSHMRR